MVTIQLTDEQVAEIKNRANDKVADNKLVCMVTKEVKFNNWTPDKRRRRDRDGDRDCGHCAGRTANLLLTVLADLRSLRLAAETASRKEVDRRIVVIIDGIENAIAES